MRILMLGWEFPPYISGGLGTACYGLTRGLDALGHEVVFVLPKAARGSRSPRVSEVPTSEGFARVTFRGVPSSISSPYAGMGEAVEHDPTCIEVELGEGISGVRAMSPDEQRAMGEQLRATGLEQDVVRSALSQGSSYQLGSSGYDCDVTLAAARYAQMVRFACAGERFDVIHAHDWMTFPAGLTLAKRSGKPLVAHMHSTELDRSVDRVNTRIYDIERAGMLGADRVVCVSYLTRSICAEQYRIPEGKLCVIHNGVEISRDEPEQLPTVEAGDKIVLFLGRITMQKGPEYFIAAAKRVLEKVENVKFVLTGSGDMATRMLGLASSMGIGHKVLFTGFLRGADVAKVFRMADCYVMPSVSEPFGIAPLEAMGHDVPVIISKQSGVSEVLRHVLKVDFWDIDEMANKIIAVLVHEPLGKVLREHGALEVRRLTWRGAAEQCVRVYEEAQQGGEAEVVVCTMQGVSREV